MQSIFGDLKGLLKTENVATDNFVFRLHYKCKFFAHTFLLKMVSPTLTSNSRHATPTRSVHSPTRGEAILWRPH